MNQMEVIILAGGLGTRLRSVVSDVPKPMADIRGRPFLSYLLDYFAGQGTKRILLSVGCGREVIMRHFGDSYRDMEIFYVEEDEPLGTGGALRKALKYAQKETVVAANGDSFFALDLHDMVRFHLQQGACMTIAGKAVEQHGRYGTILLRDHLAVGFPEKSSGAAGVINGGVYVINRDRLSEAFEPYEGAFSFETDFLHSNILKLNAYVYITDGYFIDIGVPEDYERACRELKSHMPKRADDN